MRPDELYDLFRHDVVDNTLPYLWSDEEVYAYMNDAYTMFVRLTGGIPDVLGSACTVYATANEPFSDIHPKILRIRQAELTDTGEEVKVINAQDVNALTDEDYGVLRRLNSISTTGRIRYMITGLAADVVRWVQVPAADTTVTILVDRLPLDPIVGDEPDFEGVKDHHHVHFLKWMRHLAYSKQDTETYNKQRALEEKLAFEEYCQLAKKEKEQYKHKVRVVRYGGL